MKNSIKSVLIFILSLGLFTSCSEEKIENNPETSLLENFIRSTKDFKTFESNFENISNKLNWDTAAKFEQEKTGSWVAQIETIDKKGNLFIISNGNSFYQDISNIKTEIISYSVDLEQEYKFKVENGEVIDFNLNTREPCSIGYAAGCAAMGILVGGGPQGIIVFAACMLTCDSEQQ